MGVSGAARAGTLDVCGFVAFRTALRRLLRGERGRQQSGAVDAIPNLTGTGSQWAGRGQLGSCCVVCDGDAMLGRAIRRLKGMVVVGRRAIQDNNHDISFSKIVTQ